MPLLLPLPRLLLGMVEVDTIIMVVGTTIMVVVDTTIMVVDIIITTITDTIIMDIMVSIFLFIDLHKAQRSFFIKLNYIFFNRKIITKRSININN